MTLSVTFDYKTPDDIKSGIPEAFYIALVGEIVSVFGTDVLSEAESPFGIVFIAGTSGYELAFKSVCFRFGLQKLWEYYDSLTWWESDQFDGEIMEKVVEFANKEREENPNDYYLYLLNEKEW